MYKKNCNNITSELLIHFLNIDAVNSVVSYTFYTKFKVNKMYCNTTCQLFFSHVKMA